MADIQILCAHCGSQTTISEFADGSLLVCRSCGRKLNKPPPREKSKPSLQVRKEADEPVHTTGKASSKEESQLESGAAKRARRRSAKQRREKIHLKHHVASWFIFLLLGGFMYLVRYRHVLPLYESALRQMSPIIVAAFYVLILLKAFKDSVFQGIMCLVLPPYALYYTFLSCDDFYLRAIFGGILVGIGQDAATEYRFMLIKAYWAVKSWIEGGALR